MAQEIAPDLVEGQALVHLSGALPLDTLEPALRRGSFHPLQSFPTPKPRAHFAGITIGIAASDQELQRDLEILARELQATPRLVPDDQRTLYHAAAVTAGPSLVALVAAAVDILVDVGWTSDGALAALLPLVKGTVDNLVDDGLPGALIGPVRRGDSATVERQLRALRATSDTTAGVYRALARQAVAVARRAGLAAAAADDIEAIVARQDEIESRP